MPFQQVSFVKEPYNSLYGAKSLQKRFTYTPSDSVCLPENKKKINGKYKKQKTVSNAVKTAAIVALTAIGVYKGKGLIQAGIKGLGSTLRKGGEKFASKCPNLSQAFKSFGEACKAPTKPFKAIGTFVGKIFKKG